MHKKVVKRFGKNAISIIFSLRFYSKKDISVKNEMFNF